MTGAVFVLDAETSFDIPEIGDRKMGDRISITYVFVHLASISLGLSGPRREILPEG